MPIMTRSSCHSETIISVIDSDASLNDRGDFGSQEGPGHVAVKRRRRREHERPSGAYFIVYFLRKTSLNVAAYITQLPASEHLNSRVFLIAE